MATKTTNYNLTKPAYDEDADIAVINKNMDIIDSKMKEIENASGGGAQITVDDQLSETSTNPVQNKVISSKINELKSDLKMLGWTVPVECPVHNFTTGNVFTQLVDRVDLGSLDWTYQGNGDGYVFASNQLNFLQSNIANNDVIYKAYCRDYIIVSANYLWSKNIDKIIAFAPAGKCLRICNKAYTDATAFKNAMQGVYLYYELANPITKNVDGNELYNNYLTTQEFINRSESVYLTNMQEKSIGTWIDGSTIYQATIPIVSIIGSNSPTVITTDLSSFDIKDIVSIKGILKNSSGVYYECPFRESDNNYITLQYSSNAKLLGIANGSATSGTLHVTIQYTKN